MVLFAGHPLQRLGFLATLVATIAMGFETFPARAQTNGVASATRDIDALLSFVGGSSLAPAERATVAKETAGRFESDPSIRKFADQLHGVLAKLPDATPLDVAEARQNVRLGIALLPRNDPYRQIIEAHDPTVFFDRNHKLLVTEATLAAWQHACDWIARLYAVPAPEKSDFVATQRRFVRDRFSTLTAIQKDGIANVESTFPMAVIFVSRIDKKKLATAIAKDRAAFEDRQHFALNASEGLEKVDVAAMRALFMQRLIGNAMVLNNGFSTNYFNHRERQETHP